MNATHRKIRSEHLVVRGPHCGRRRLHRGLSLVEVMITLAIAGTLLVATGMAWVGSTNAVEINDRTARSLQASSVAMLQLTSQVRACQNIDVGGTFGANKPTQDGTYSSTYIAVAVPSGDLANPHQYGYRYDPTLKQLLFVNNDVTPAVTHVLADHVTACTFWLDVVQQPVPTVLRMSVQMTVDPGNYPFTLSGSAALRENVVYYY